MNLTPGEGLKFRLSEGAEGAEQRSTTPPTKGDPLSENETSGILKRPRHNRHFRWYSPRASADPSTHENRG